MRALLVLSVMSVSMFVTSAAAQARSERALATTKIDSYITSTWYREKVMGTPVTKTSRSYQRTTSLAYIVWVEHKWRKINQHVLQQYQSPPHLSQFLCIHHYEGSWTDTGAPYYGGLQMDTGFQSSYGKWLVAKKGTADHWSPLEQIWTAEHALKSRGYWPWPNTARYCNLL